MSHTIIDLPPVGDDGRLYRDTALNFVESLIPNPWNSCHAPDLLELENGDLAAGLQAPVRETRMSALLCRVCQRTVPSGKHR